MMGGLMRRMEQAIIDRSHIFCRPATGLPYSGVCCVNVEFFVD